MVIKIKEFDFCKERFVPNCNILTILQLLIFSTKVIPKHSEAIIRLWPTMLLIGNTKSNKEKGTDLRS